MIGIEQNEVGEMDIQREEDSYVSHAALKSLLGLHTVHNITL